MYPSAGMNAAAAAAVAAARHPVSFCVKAVAGNFGNYGIFFLLFTIFLY